MWCQFISQVKPLFTADLFQERRRVRLTNKVVVLVDDRENLGLWWTIPWTMHMLGPDWALQIIAFPHNFEFFKTLVNELQIKNSYVDLINERFGYGPWVSDRTIHRVQFFLSKQFWQGVRAEHVLIIQDHGVPVRRLRGNAQMRKLFAKVSTYSYAGAPWSLEETSAEPMIDATTNLRFLKRPAGRRWFSDPGGNGGFSYRKRSAMIKHGVDLGVATADLLRKSTDLRPLGTYIEDWCWGKILGDSNQTSGAAPKLLEHEFASELLHHPQPFGVHNFAGHHSPNATLQIIRLALNEFFQRPVEVVLDTVSEQLKDRQSVWVDLQDRFPTSVLPKECSV